MSPTLRRPVRVEFVGIMPTLFAHCEHCMEVMHGTGLMPYSEQLEEYPEDVKKQYFELSEVAQKIRDEFGGAVFFDAIDSASPQGVWMTLRHRILRTPCVLIEGKKVFDRLPGYEELRQKILELADTPTIRH
ncbi:MAG: hypothetical protein E6K95_05455 [Thaumarchaeota archaeon]|nr:MAG: hypothetical protein E6K90_00375 [Nitrososphaerota archaeon]TLY02567.1 MAG: hypothetical protein E6K95_05455 [Nitrososphaerota archaeon]TLY17601.1 MAG: hypothetical protein E6K86_01410 [Nitrososphaerota archaeon]